MKKFIFEYFNFTRKERNGVLIITILILIFSVLPFLLPLFISHKQYSHAGFEKEISALKIKQADSADERQGYFSRNYRRPAFHNAHTPSTPYLRYPESNDPKEEYKPFERKRSELKPFDINTADTSAFIALPGIGNKLANRIISFREKLGGFYKIEQVAETYGLQDSVFQKIKSKLLATNPVLKQLDINTAGPDELKQHPYIRYILANAIVQYRTQHGNFNSVSDIKRIQIVTDEIFDKLAPYLTVK